MRVDILTCLPSLLESPFAHSIVKRAINKGLLRIHIHNLHDYSTNKHRKVDDYAYGGEAGMVLSIEPIVRCIRQLQSQNTYQEIIYMAPDGVPLTQSIANQLSLKDNIIILCGHYKGIDERIRQHFVTQAMSIGDYVLSGGELPAAVLVDTLVRLLPGVLSDETAALTDSFQDHLVASPVYTGPADFEGLKVPDILLSGDAGAIQQWREQEAVKRTQQHRPDLYQKLNDHES